MKSFLLPILALAATIASALSDEEWVLEHNKNLFKKVNEKISEELRNDFLDLGVRSTLAITSGECNWILDDRTEDVKWLLQHNQPVLERIEHRLPEDKKAFISLAVDDILAMRYFYHNLKSFTDSRMKSHLKHLKDGGLNLVQYKRVMYCEQSLYKASSRTRAFLALRDCLRGGYAYKEDAKKLIEETHTGTDSGEREDCDQWDCALTYGLAYSENAIMQLILASEIATELIKQGKLMPQNNLLIANAAYKTLSKALSDERLLDASVIKYLIDQFSPTDTEMYRRDLDQREAYLNRMDSASHQRK